MALLATSLTIYTTATSHNILAFAFNCHNYIQCWEQCQKLTKKKFWRKWRKAINCNNVH